MCKLIFYALIFALLLFVVCITTDIKNTHRQIPDHWVKMIPDGNLKIVGCFKVQ